MIYKICSAEEWQQALRRGCFDGSEVDQRDGYIHFSTAEQVAVTVAKHFSGRSGPVLVAIDADALGPALKWEPSRGGALFPHLYAPLGTSAAIGVIVLPDTGEGRALIFAGLQSD